LVFVVLASIAGAALLLNVLTRKDLGLCLFATAPGVVGTLYIGAYLGPLRETAVVLFYAGLAAIAIAAVIAIRRKCVRALLSEVLSPGPLFLAAGAVAYWVAYRNGTFLVWDEFNDWGPAIREMYLTNSFPAAGSVQVFQDYPRGTALFQYFFVVNAFWSEAAVCFAHFTLSAVPFVALFRGYRWRQAHWALLTLVFVLLLCHMTGLWLRVTYVDFALAAYFGVLLAIYFTSQAEMSTTAFLIPSLFMMPLIKTPGFGFALVCVAIICTDLLIRHVFRGSDATLREVMRAIRQKAGKAAKVNLGSFRQYAAAVAQLASAKPWKAFAAWLGGWYPSKAAVVLTIVILAPLAAQGSWQVWVRANRLRCTHNFGEGNSYATALRSFRRAPTPFELVTRQAFVAALSSRPIGLLCEKTIYTDLQKKWPTLASAGAPKRLTAIEYTLIALALFAVAFVMLPSAGARISLVASVIILFAGFAAYLVCLLADYLMGIFPPDGVRLLEFHRYVWGYLMAVVLLAWGLVAASGEAPHRRRRLRASIAFASLFALTLYLYVFENPQYFIIPTDPAAIPDPFKADWQQLRDNLRTRVEFTRSVVKAGEPVYIIFQDAPGLMYHVAGYELFPLITTQLYWTEKGAVYPYDPYHHAMPPAKLARKLANFSYLLIIHSDETFWQTYKSLFEPPEKRTKGDFLFRVTYKPSGEMVLKAVR